MFTPHNPSSISDIDQPDVSGSSFEEFPDIFQTLYEGRSVLLRGAPGSGKTNVIRDLEEHCRTLRIPYLTLAVHLNAGTTATVDETRTLLDGYADANRQHGGLLILDNADYIGYKGHRSAVKAVTYAKTTTHALIRTMGSEGIRTLGTAHSEDWQVNQWRWGRPDIDEAQAALLQAFDTTVVFEGALTTKGVFSILAKKMHDDETRTDAPDVRQMAGDITRYGRNFHLLNHVDLSVFVRSPLTALHEIDKGRQLRLGNS